jgi:hypothetical protein
MAKLADGVAAMVGVQPGHGAGPVGDERVVAPGWEQLLLLIVQVTDPADDQPVTLVAGLGDLRDPARLVDDLHPGRLGIAAIAPRTVLVWRTVIE